MLSVLRSGPVVPVLETERLIMRGHRLADFDECAAMWADPIVTRYVGGRPFTEEEVWTRLLRYVGHWALMGFGCWVVEDRATGAFIGEVGFAEYRREMQPSIKDFPELGWMLASRAHGRGYATEAVRAALAWGDVSFGNARTVCIIDPGNQASIRVADKVGYVRREVGTYKGQPILLFERYPT